MARTKKEPVFSCSHKSYDLDGWEGGIAVYAMDGEHGTKIIAVPKLGVSTCLTGYGDGQMVRTMLEKNRTMQNDSQKDGFANSILNDFTK